eukprot:g400.t1
MAPTYSKMAMGQSDCPAVAARDITASTLTDDQRVNRVELIRCYKALLAPLKEPFPAPGVLTDSSKLRDVQSLIESYWSDLTSWQDFKATPEYSAAASAFERFATLGRRYLPPLVPTDVALDMGSSTGPSLSELSKNDSRVKKLKTTIQLSNLQRRSQPLVSMRAAQSADEVPFQEIERRIGSRQQLGRNGPNSATLQNGGASALRITSKLCGPGFNPSEMRTKALAGFATTDPARLSAIATAKARVAQYNSRKRKRDTAATTDQPSKRQK